MFRRVDLDARAEKSRWIDLPTRARLDLSTATGVDKSRWVNMATGAEEFRLDDLAARADKCRWVDWAIRSEKSGRVDLDAGASSLDGST